MAPYTRTCAFASGWLVVLSHAMNRTVPAGGPLPWLVSRGIFDIRKASFQMYFLTVGSVQIPVCALIADLPELSLTLSAPRRLWDLMETRSLTS